MVETTHPSLVPTSFPVQSIHHEAYPQTVVSLVMLPKDDDATVASYGCLVEAIIVACRRSNWLVVVIITNHDKCMANTE